MQKIEREHWSEVVEDKVLDERKKNPLRCRSLTEAEINTPEMLEYLKVLRGDKPRERWRSVVGYEKRYEVSDRGRLRSFPKIYMLRVYGANPKWMARILKPQLDTNGYYIIRLSDDGKQKPYFVHRLVLEAFIGSCPDGLECCHNNGIKTDNRLENLRWDTHKSNMEDYARYRRHRS